MTRDMVDDEKQDVQSSTPSRDDSASEIDLYSFHEKRAGRLIIDPMYVPLLSTPNL